jgi:hypothetical protein
MVFVECFGGIWSLSDAAYRRLLRARADGAGPDLDDYGRRVTNEVVPFTDMTAEQAKAELHGMRALPPRRA